MSYNTASMWDLKEIIQTNLFTKQKQSYICRKQTYGYQREWLMATGGNGAGISWETETETYTLVSVNQVTHKDLPLTHFAVYLELTQHYK